jgi:hypothetical protein
VEVWIGLPGRLREPRQLRHQNHATDKDDDGDEEGDRFVYAWNAFRQEKVLQSIRHDTRNSWLTVSE